MPRVLIAPSHLRHLPGAFLDALIGAGFEVSFPREKRQMVEDEVIEHLAGIDAVLAGSEPYTPKVLAAFPQLKVIARAGVGWDAVDVAAATRLGKVVTFTPGTNHEAVAEHAFMLILNLAKNFVAQHLAVGAGKWPRAATEPIRGKLLGLVGLGRIGKAMVTRAQAFGMSVAAHDAYPDRPFCEAQGVRLLELDEIFAEADVLSLHAPAIPATYHLVDARRLKLMKPTAYLINTARGPLIDEPALAEALRAGTIAGAGLDVFDVEPPSASPLISAPNTVMTAHTAGVDTRSRDDMALRAAEAIVRLWRGDWPEGWVVNPEVRPAFRWARGE